MPYLFLLRSCDRAASWHVTVHRDMWPCCIVTNCFIIKPTRCTNFTNLFWHETLHVSDSSSVRHQEFTNCTLSYGICHTRFVDSFRAGPGWNCLKAVYKTVWHIPLPSVQWINSWWWADELSETCRVSCRNKFGKFVHLVGFIIKQFVTMQHGHMNVNRKKDWKIERIGSSASCFS
jgi:hypothetical protein